MHESKGSEMETTRPGGHEGRKGEFKMYETVKIVNGHAITRMMGSRRFYHVRLDEHRERTFHTIKAAAAFCESL